MTSKGRTAQRLEIEIQIARDENNWKKVIELAELLKARSPNLDLLSTLLIGEGKLELYLIENPPLEINIPKAKNGLNEARKYLLKSCSKEAKEAYISLDAFLLLGKLNFACGNYDETLDNFEKADLLNLPEKQLPSRSMKIVAESYAIKAFCLEKKLTHHSTHVEDDTEEDKKLRELITKCIEIATDLTFVYLQELEEKNLVTHNQNHSNTGTLPPGGSPQPPSPGKIGSAEGWRGTGIILQQLITRIQTIAISNDPRQHPDQVKRLRNLLTVYETTPTQCVRLFMARQLAELLLRGHASGPNYKPLEMISKRKSEGAWKPKRYAQINQFIANNEHEEIILLLLISEAMAVRNAVLSQSPEFKEQRLRSYDVACNIYDQLAVCLVRWGQAKLFHECLERGAIKFSFEEAHTWQQYALSLVSIGEHEHALRVLEEVYRLLPHSPIPCMIAAKTCYLHLKDYEEGIKWCKRAISTKEGQPYATHSSRAHMLLGIGLYLRSLDSTQYLTRTHLTDKAIDILQKAYQMGPADHLIQHHLALVLAQNRKLPEAITSIKQALNFRPDFVPSLHLLGLLLTAQKQYQEALNLVLLTLEEWPDSLDLLLLQAHLELFLSGPEAAKVIASKMLTKWKVLYEDQTQSVGDPTNQSERRSESRSLFHLSESGSNPTQISRGINGNFSESSLSSLPKRKASGIPWDWLVRIWLLLAELCLHAKQKEQALKCIDEAQQIQSMTPDILVAKGMACEIDGCYIEAKNYYESAISLEPNHLRGLQHLGKVYNCLGKHDMSQFMLMKAAKLHPTEHETWYTLGLALEAKGEHNESANCMAVALDVENSSPLLPFSTVPLVLE